MKTISNVNGVHYSRTISRWIARSPSKQSLYRGESMVDAEAARMDFDAGKFKRGNCYNKPKQLFKSCFQPEWQPSRVTSNVLNDGFYEI